MTCDIKPGQEFEVKYPFVWDLREDFDLTGKVIEVRYWRPGHTYKNGYNGDTYAQCDAYGSARFTVVGVFSPPKFPTRVFYVRDFCSPAGVRFGKKNLHICTLGKFRRLVRGYQFKCELSGLWVAA